ncbi:hypothetical protein SARC_00448 [Sphaeroforma arctica JP610]|uniref:Uncharacterized protein n=1 Tax=Sphaeroforma arctica JP610 TaxID=667725 RepID=A0A0L0GEW6_9EUKA|nr:hypothetical protein SARC_00448 [Sphaeroforma arctica JP610]KNC87411.1 hypothetical protein SARC_00448 [Sphaeroforma arctica JP610]|eukprot:XP_014161313.1 hypothetical protein SARC_00448 [Sphaeroforma arctica JP610]
MGPDMVFTPLFLIKCIFLRLFWLSSSRSLHITALEPCLSQQTRDMFLARGMALRNSPANTLQLNGKIESSIHTKVTTLLLIDSLQPVALWADTIAHADTIRNENSDANEHIHSLPISGMVPLSHVSQTHATDAWSCSNSRVQLPTLRISIVPLLALAFFSAVNLIVPLTPERYKTLQRNVNSIPGMSSASLMNFPNGTLPENVARVPQILRATSSLQSGIILILPSLRQCPMFQPFLRLLPHLHLFPSSMRPPLRPHKV